MVKTVSDEAMADRAPVIAIPVMQNNNVCNKNT
jgi:hypothetical protein